MPGGFAPAPVAAAPAAYAPPPLPVTPNHGFVAGPTAVAAPPLPVAPVPVPVPAAPQMTAKAGGATYEQFIQGGWNDVLLRSEGMML
jgi:hypothetical protein